MNSPTGRHDCNQSAMAGLEAWLDLIGFYLQWKTTPQEYQKRSAGDNANRRQSNHRRRLSKIETSRQAQKEHDDV